MAYTLSRFETDGNMAKKRETYEIFQTPERRGKFSEEV